MFGWVGRCVGILPPFPHTHPRPPKLFDVEIASRREGVGVQLCRRICVGQSERPKPSDKATRWKPPLQRASHSPTCCLGARPSSLLIGICAQAGRRPLAPKLRLSTHPAAKRLPGPIPTHLGPWVPCITVHRCQPRPPAKEGTLLPKPCPRMARPWKQMREAGLHVWASRGIPIEELIQEVDASASPQDAQLTPIWLSSPGTSRGGRRASAAPNGG